ncbi:16S rRNA (guanine(527)-N(7))-methyltransferase RsmG [soil metagenome]
MSAAVPDDIAAVEALCPVSRETASRLKTFVELLIKWQKAENLIASGTLPDVWRRHVADSADLVRLFPESARWLDLGSGAGFPGLVVAIAGKPGTRVHLVESNRRKCAFLRQAIRATGAPAEVHEGRAGEVLRSLSSGGIDRVSARAVAPLTDLLAMAAPVMTQSVSAAFHKGLDFRREVAEATQSWDFDLIEHQSRIGDGVILEISNLRRKAVG